MNSSCYRRSYHLLEKLNPQKSIDRLERPFNNQWLGINPLCLSTLWSVRFAIINGDRSVLTDASVTSPLSAWISLAMSPPYLLTYVLLCLFGDSNEEVASPFVDLHESGTLSHVRDAMFKNAKLGLNHRRTRFVYSACSLSSSREV